MIGKVCVCSIGRVGVVTGQREFDWGESWVGFGLDGRGLWSATKPHVLADSIAEYAEMVEARPTNLLYR